MQYSSKKKKSATILWFYTIFWLENAGKLTLSCISCRRCETNAKVSKVQQSFLISVLWMSSPALPQAVLVTQSSTTRKRPQLAALSDSLLLIISHCAWLGSYNHHREAWVCQWFSVVPHSVEIDRQSTLSNAFSKSMKQT